MKSIVQELQAAALDSKMPITDLLRRVIFVASKLGLGDIIQWVEHELDGYPANERLIPQYRVIRGVLKANSLVFGWGPVHFEDDKKAELASTIRTKQPIGEIEAMSKRKGALVFPANRKMLPHLSGPSAEDVRVDVDQSHLVRIVDSVRTRALQFALELEHQGILGVGMSFSAEEKQRARSEEIHEWAIQNMTVGVIGNVGGNVRIKANQKSAVAQRFSVVRQALITVREHIDDLPKNQQEEVTDLLHAVEDELKDHNPRSSRLRTLLSAIGRAATWTGKKAVEAAIGGAIKSLMGS